MIIMPITIKNKNNNKEYSDEWGNIYKDIINRISINQEKSIGRLEKVSYVFSDDKENENVSIYKECAIGPITYKKNEPMLYFDNYNYSMNELLDGRYIQSGGYSQYPGDYDSYVEYGYNDFIPTTSIPLNNDHFVKRTLPSLKFNPLTLGSIRDEIMAFENAYQLPYINTLGLLNVFFATWSYIYPIECSILIDSKMKKFNVPKIKYLEGPSVESVRYIYGNLIKDIDKLCNCLFDVLEKEKKVVKIFVFLHPFGAVMRVKDINRMSSERFDVYSSNQVEELIKNVWAGGLKYIGGDGINILKESYMKDAFQDALDCCDLYIL
jgi:hypothetical protein